MKRLAKFNCKDRKENGLQEIARIRVTNNGQGNSVINEWKFLPTDGGDNGLFNYFNPNPVEINDNNTTNYVDDNHYPECDRHLLDYGDFICLELLLNHYLDLEIPDPLDFEAHDNIGPPAPAG